jgi:Bacterial extracellular solute-binding proteins, family 3
VCLYAGFAPFAYKDDKGDWQGWDVSYLKGFAAANDLSFQPVEAAEFDNIWLLPGDGKCDIAGTGISDLKERREATSKNGGSWSNTYYHVLRAFVVRTADFPQLTRIEDLRGKKAIVTKGSTANSDLCYRMKAAGLHPCKKADGDHPCLFTGLENWPETSRQTDPSCVFIEYPWQNEEKCAGADVAKSYSRDQDPGTPFAYGGGYGSVQGLACDSSGSGDCSYGVQTLATVWPHCNMASDGKGYAEPFSFVVRSTEPGLLEALNCYINTHPYPGAPIPVLSPACATPPWTPAPDPVCSR